jgi:hypothetical protein
MNHLPVAIGLVLCEQVIVDEKTRNLTPVNCFGSLKLESVPGSASFHVVAWLADGLGEMPVELVVRRLDSLDEVMRLERRLKFEDRLIDMRFTARIRDCAIPVAGYYEVLLSVDGELVAHRKVLFHV